MNKTQRQEGRFQRRKAEREAKIAARSASCGDFETAFSYENLYQSGKKCCKGVRWKSSTQRFEANIATTTEEIHADLQRGTYKGRGFVKFGIWERGHFRNIQSVHITERVVQKNLCDEVLVPAFSASFIYDNGASMKGKGMDFALDRLTAHLQRHFRQYGREGGILQWDLSGFFASIPHAILTAEALRRVLDDRVRALYQLFVDAFGPVGMGLGSQVSQISALLAASPIDHLFKDSLGVKGYGRYMDDGYIISPSTEKLKEYNRRLHEAAARIGLKINEKKTRIVKLTQHFTFLKMRFHITEFGAVVRRLARSAFSRMRRKLKKFHTWYLAGKIALEDICTSFQSFRGHARRARSYKSLKKVDRLFESLFGKGLLCLSY